jgi:hypothetical protein
MEKFFVISIPEVDEHPLKLIIDDSKGAQNEVWLLAEPYGKNVPHIYIDSFDESGNCVKGYRFSESKFKDIETDKLWEV